MERGVAGVSRRSSCVSGIARAQRPASQVGKLEWPELSDAQGRDPRRYSNFLQWSAGWRRMPRDVNALEIAPILNGVRQERALQHRLAMWRRRDLEAAVHINQKDLVAWSNKYET